MSVDENQVEALFYAVCEQPDDTTRYRLLDEHCRGNPDLRSRVERLFAAHRQSDQFLLAPLATIDPTTGDLELTVAVADDCTARLSADKLENVVVAGKYRLGGVIGEGGMGAVYRAEQFTPMKRVVAVKVLRADLQSAYVLQRFDAERQVLALMDHPHIARMIDAGTTQDGRPFFVMEYVDGPTLIRYCHLERLDIRARLGLFLCVCTAVQHAHQKGIIHRDLKPTNILVARNDGIAIPKVIDFGVAKSLAPDFENVTPQTGLGTIVGTIEYMSPEQADFRPSEIDTRTDVYSLGVVLFELLTGVVPFPRQHPGSGRGEDILQAIRESDPPRPSQVVRNTAASPGNSGLDRDLDAIILKCLEKSPDNRYASVKDLATDLLSFLDGAPLLASRPTNLGRLRRWWQRNPSLAISISVAILALLAGTVASTYFGIAESRRARAETAARELSTQRLALAYVHEARALRTSGRPGQRFVALAALQKAQQILGPTREIANEAVAALSLPDWKVEYEFAGHPADTVGFAIAPTFDRFARADRDGTIKVRSLPDDQPIVELPLQGTLASAGGLQFSPDGGLLLVVYARPQPMSQIWELQPSLQQICAGNAAWAAVSHRSESVAIVHAQELEIWQRVDRKRHASFELPRDLRDGYFSFSEDDSRLVLANQSRAVQLEIASGQFTELSLPLKDGTDSWPIIHPLHGAILLTSSHDPKHAQSQWWLASENRSLAPPLLGLSNGGRVATITSDGNILFTNDWSHVLRMWDGRSGRLLLSRPSQNRNWIVVNHDQTLVGPEIVTPNVRILRFKPGSEHGVLSHSSDSSRGFFAEWNQAISPNGAWLALTFDDQVSLFDLENGIELGELPDSAGYGMNAIRFLEDGTLCTYSQNGWQSWPVEYQPESRTLVLGPPTTDLKLRASNLKASASRDGRVIAAEATLVVGIRKRAVVIGHAPNHNPDEPFRLFHVVAEQHDARSVSVSQDGRWVATGRHSKLEEAPRNAHVWDSTTGQLLVDFAISELCTVQFSPLDTYLVIHSNDSHECQIIETATWEKRHTLSSRGRGVFSADESIFAIESGSGQISLRRGDTLEEFAALSLPRETVLIPLFFTPDNAALFARDVETRQIHYWMLDELRRELEELGLAQSWPPIARSSNRHPRPVPKLVVRPAASYTSRGYE